MKSVSVNVGVDVAVPGKEVSTSLGVDHVKENESKTTDERKSVFEDEEHYQPGKNQIERIVTITTRINGQSMRNIERRYVDIEGDGNRLDTRQMSIDYLNQRFVDTDPQTAPEPESVQLTLSNPRFADGLHYNIGSYNLPPEAAIDGSWINHNVATGFAHSIGDQNPKFSVDLPENSVVKTVTIYPRRNCCWDRYAEMTVSIGNVECAPAQSLSASNVRANIGTGLVWNCKNASGQNIEVVNRDQAIQIAEIVAVGYQIPENSPETRPSNPLKTRPYATFAMRAMGCQSRREILYRDRCYTHIGFAARGRNLNGYDSAFYPTPEPYLKIFSNSELYSSDRSGRYESKNPKFSGEIAIGNSLSTTVEVELWDHDTDSSHDLMCDDDIRSSDLLDGLRANGQYSKDLYCHEGGSASIVFSVGV